MQCRLCKYNNTLSKKVEREYNKNNLKVNNYLYANQISDPNHLIVSPSSHFIPYPYAFYHSAAVYYMWICWQVPERGQKKRPLVLVRVPRDHDLVLEFDSVSSRRKFMTKFEAFLNSHKKHMISLQVCMFFECTVIVVCHIVKIILIFQTVRW